ncbi:MULTISPECIES: hypothetical protein [unclassified Rhizobium]|uniref:hypothetical protein n=1 Tax=unclassified Rhizobium TaxID=2613769 RepID=UPI0016215965|nr:MULTISPECIES: hypothetical protein [unclassified Rhizobium]MBB3542037.1 hypothetical protein [Rhizobium sp. BK399]MCS3740382.1 hypothetical protein [Rhizobium sp. BK661]MCS4094161.1 hypothetical protein [Rhizobium sp. BK176]
MPKHYLLLLAVTIPLDGCAIFAPAYNEAVYTKLEGAHSSLTKIETALGTKAPQRTRYRDVEPYYIEALAMVKDAGEIAGQRPAYLQGKPSARAAQLLADNIERCRQSIELSRAAFEENGQQPNEADNISIVRNTCGIARTMEGSLK